jgi:HlyD family secretion protein
VPHNKSVRDGHKLTLALVLVAATSTLSMAQRPAAKVVVVPVIERQVTAGQVSVGTIMPLRRALIGSAVDGRVVEFPLNEGDRVDKGQTLAQLMTDTIQLELRGAEAELEFRRSQYAELKNGSRPEEIEQVRARMAAADVKQQFLQSRRIRTETIHKSSSVVSKDELEEAIATAAEAVEDYRQAKAIYDLAVRGPRIERIAQAMAQVAIQEAVVARLRDQLGKHSISARFAGYLVAEHTEVGQWVNRGDTVAEVAELDEVEIVAQVAERSVPFVKPGQRVRVEVPALPDRLFAGIVSSSVPQADVRARTFPVKIRLRNEISDLGPLLKAGMFARITLPVGPKINALLVPKDAIVLGGPTPVVYVIEAGSDGQHGTVAAERVELGVAQDSLIQITGAVGVGQLAVVMGNERLHPGQTVEIVRAAKPDATSQPASSQP